VRGSRVSDGVELKNNAQSPTGRLSGSTSLTVMIRNILISLFRMIMRLGVSAEIASLHLQ